MILLYSHLPKAKLRIVGFLQTQSDEAVIIAPTDKEIIALAKQHRPRVIFLSMPGRPGTARDIQSHLRELLPQTRVRILPIVDATGQAGGDWQSVVTKALHGTSLLSRKEDQP